MPIQTLRGLACLLLVLFHVVGDSPAAGLRVPSGDALQQINQLLACVRMPLFAGIAGWVYAMRPSGADWTGFLGSKLRRLVLPLIAVGLPFTWAQAATPVANASSGGIAALPWVPAGHFWFLESLFLIFVLIVPLERVGALRSARACLLAAAVSAALLSGLNLPPWLDIFGGTFYLGIFFLIGLAMKRFGLITPARRQAAGLLFALAAALELLLWGMGQPLWTRNSPGGLAMGALVVLLLLGQRWQWRPLAWLGGHSYAVYLFHVFFTAAARITLEHLGADSLFLLVPAGVAAGVFGPVVVGRLIGQFPLAATVFLGERLAPAPRHTAAQRAGS